MKKKRAHISVLLHDIRSTHNVGSIFRTADAAGVEKIYLSGFSPLPTDKYGRSRRDISKVALGAEKSVSWQSIKNPITLIRKLKKEKYNVVALEQDKQSSDYRKIKPSGNNLFILGSEVGGVPQNILKEADYIAEIKMRGEKESLNVSVSFGIALFRILNI